MNFLFPRTPLGRPVQVLLAVALLGQFACVGEDPTPSGGADGAATVVHDGGDAGVDGNAAGGGDAGVGDTGSSGDEGPADGEVDAGGSGNVDGGGGADANGGVDDRCPGRAPDPGEQPAATRRVSDLN